MAKRMRGKRKLWVKILATKKPETKEDSVNKVPVCLIQKGSEVDCHAEDPVQDAANCTVVIKGKDNIDKKKTEEELKTHFLGSEYKNCSVHLTRCKMDICSNNYGKNLEISDCKKTSSSANVRRVVECNRKFLKKISKIKESVGSGEKTLPKFWNSPAVEVFEKTTPGKMGTRLSGDSIDVSNNDFSSCENEQSASFVASDSKYCYKRRKSLSVTDDEDTSNGKRKKPSVADSEKAQTKGNSQFENGRGVYRPTKQCQQKSVDDVMPTKKKKIKIKNSAKMSAPSVTKEKICNESDVGLSKKQLTSLKTSGGTHNLNGKRTFIKTPAEKKMYIEKVHNLESLVKAENTDGSENEEKQEEEEAHTGGRVHNDIDVDHCVESRKINEKDKQKTVKMPVGIRSAHKPGNTNNVKNNKQLFVELVDISENVVRRQWSEQTLVTNSVESTASDVFKHDGDNNNNSEASNICETYHESKNDRRETKSPEVSTRNFKESKLSTSNSQLNVKEEQEDNCVSSDDRRSEITFAADSCNFGTNSNRNKNEVANSESSSPKLVTLSEEQLNNPEQNHCINSDISSENSDSSDEEEKSVSESSDQVLQTSTIIRNRSSSDTDKDDSDAEEIHCTTNVKQRRKIIGSDDDDEQSYSESEKKLEQNIRNERQVNVSGEQTNRRISDSDEDSEGSQCSGHEDQDQSLGVSIYNNNNSKQCEYIKSKVPSEDNYARTNSAFCNNSVSEVDDSGNNSDNSDGCDGISLYADSLTMNFISSGHWAKNSIPNPFLPAQKAPERSVFTARDHNPQITAQETIINSRSNYTNRNHSASNFGVKVTNYNRCNNVLPEKYFDSERSSNVFERSRKSETVVSGIVTDIARGSIINKNGYGRQYNNAVDDSYGSFDGCNRNCNNNVWRTDYSITAGIAASDNFERPKVNLLGDVPNKIVSVSRSLDENGKSSRGNNNETENKSTGTKFNFKIPKISTRLSATRGNKDRPVSGIVKDSGKQQQNDVLNKRLAGSVSAVKKTETSKIDVKPGKNEEVNKINPISERNRTNNLLEREGTETKRDFELPAIKETECDKVSISPKNGNTEGMKIGPVCEINSKSKGIETSVKETILNKKGCESLAKKETDIKYVERNKFIPALDINDKCRQNELLPKEVVLNNRDNESLAVKETVPDRTRKVDENSTNIEKNKFSPVTDKNDKYIPNKLSPKDVELKKRGSELPVEETESCRTIKLKTNSNNIEITKFYPISEKNNKSEFHEVLRKEKLQKKIGSNTSALKETEPERSPKIVVLNKKDCISLAKKETDVKNIERTKFFPVLDINDKCRQNKLLLKGVVLNNRDNESLPANGTESERSLKSDLNPCKSGKIEDNLVSGKNDKSASCELIRNDTAQKKEVSDLSALKETKPERSSKICLNTNNSGKTEVHPILEKSDNCTSNMSRNENLFNRRILLSDENKIGQNVSRRKVVDQERVITKEQGPLLLTAREDGIGENIRKKIVLRGSPELKISRDTSSSSETSQKFYGVRRKLPDKISIVPEKKLKDVASEHEVQSQRCAVNAVSAASTTNKESSENPSAVKLEQSAASLKIFAGKERCTNVTVIKYPLPNTGETSRAKSKETLPKLIMNKTVTSSVGPPLPTELAENQELKKSQLNLSSLFAGCCMNYLKTSKCDPPCSFSHEVGELLIDGDHDDSVVHDLLSDLQEFLSTAACPPLSVVQNVCNVFGKYQRIDAITSISVLFTSQNARNQTEYLHNLLKIQLHVLGKYFGDAESSLIEIVRHVCSVVKAMDSKQEILDQMVTTIENTINLDFKWDVYSSLASVEDYVWTEPLLISIWEEFLRKPQRDIRKEWQILKIYVDVLLRNSHEKVLFNIWKCLPHLLKKIIPYIRRFNYAASRVLLKKMNRFQHSEQTDYTVQEECNKICGVNRETQNTESHHEDKSPGAGPTSFIESRNINAFCNNEPLYSSTTKEIIDNTISSLGSAKNLVATSSVVQKCVENAIAWNQPCTDRSLNGSGMQRPYVVREVSNKSERPENYSKNVQKRTENFSRNIQSVSSQTRERNKAGGSGINPFIRQCEKTEGLGGSQSTIVDNMNSDEHQRRETSDGVMFQNSCNNSTGNKMLTQSSVATSKFQRLSVVHSNDSVATDYCNSNNICDGKNEPPNRRKSYFPRPSGYRQRLKQFNQDSHIATAVHNDQQQHLQTAADEVNRTCVQYPHAIVEPCSSKSYNNVNNANCLTGEYINQDKSDLLNVDNHHTLKRSNSLSDLRFNINNRLKQANSGTNIVMSEQNSQNTCIRTESNENHLLDVGSGYLSDGGSRHYPPWKHTTNTNMYARQSGRSVVSRSNCVQQKQFQVPEFTVTNEYAGNNEQYCINTRDIYTRYGENSRKMQQQYSENVESHGRSTAKDVYTETVHWPDAQPPFVMNHAAAPTFSAFHKGRQNECINRRMQYNKGQMWSRRQQNGAQFQNQNVMPDCESDTIVAGARQQSPFSSASPLMGDLEEDVDSLKQYLNVNDFHNVLKVLDKWQNSLYIEDLSHHLFVLLGEVNGNRRLPAWYNTYRGLMSTALNSGNLSAGVKKSLASISLTLILEMIVDESWTYAYDIFKLLMDNDFSYHVFSCWVFTRDKHSPAKRNLIFVEVCMQAGDLEEAVSLLSKHNMLAANRLEWSLRSYEDDVVIRKELIKSLMTMTVESNNLRLAQVFLMHLIELQKDITQPINLFRPYELLLTKLLDQPEISHGPVPDSDETDILPALQLFKDVCSQLNEVVVYDALLCRALVVTCANGNEIQLAKQLVKKGFSIGAYARNTSLFTVKVNTVWTRKELTLIIEEALSQLLHFAKKNAKGSSIITAINSDLHFAVTAGDTLNRRLPKILLGFDTSINASVYRVKNVLEKEFSPPLTANHVSNGTGTPSPYLVVKQSVLHNYLSCMARVL